MAFKIYCQQWQIDRDGLKLIGKERYHSEVETEDEAIEEVRQLTAVYRDLRKGGAYGSSARYEKS